jgi:peptidoglycan hydrolase-like protein with peptidoglycan-binding domain
MSALCGALLIFLVTQEMKERFPKFKETKNMNIKLRPGGDRLKVKLVTLVTTVAISGAAAVVPFAAVADHTTAHTIEQLQAQIAALQAQLLALSGATAPVMSGKCSFTQDLTNGVRGDDVTCLQNYLTSTGHFSFSGGSTGYFGPITQNAVAAWQAANGVAPAVGYFGPISRAKYNALMASAPPSVPTTPGTPPPVTPVGSGLTVSAAFDQPPATLAPDNSARQPFTKVVFTASADGDVTVKGVTVERQGLADDSGISEVVLLDENGIQIGLAKTLNALHQANLNEAFVVRAGTSKTITVAANMASDLDGVSGQIARLAVVAVDAGSSQVNGTFPIVGNGMTYNGTLVIGSIASPARGSLDPGSARSSLEVGTKAFIASGVKWTIGSSEPVILEQIRWYQSGSAASGDLKNVKVTVKGTDYDTVISSDGKYYTAVLGSGVEYDKGATMDISIKTDVESGSDRTIDFDIQRRTDIVARGKTFGYYVTPANGTSDPIDDTGAFSSTEPYYDAYQHQISKGSLRAEKSNSVPAGNISEDVANTELGAFTFEAKGENVQVTSVTFTVTRTTPADDVTSIALYDENGTVVAGPKDSTSDTVSTVNFTDTWTIPVGVHVYTLKGKLHTDFDDADTVIVSVTPSAMTVKGENTGLTITPSPATAISANTKTVRTASLSVSLAPTPVSQTVVSGINGFVLAKVQYDASNSGEDLRVTAQALTYTTDGPGATSFDIDNINTCQLFDGATALNTGGNVVNFSSNAFGANKTNQAHNFDNHLIIPQGTIKVVDVKCNISSIATTRSFQVGINDTSDTATAVGKNTGVAVAATLTTNAGPTMTITTKGSLSVALDVSSPTQERYAIAGKTDVLLTVLKFHATNEAVKIDRIGLTLSSSTASTTDLVKVTVWDGATKVGDGIFSGTNSRATSTLSSDVIVPKDGDKLLTLKADLLAYNETSLQTNTGLRGHLVAVNYDGNAVTTTRGIGQSSGSEINPVAGADSGGAGVRVVKTYPTLERLSVPSNTLANGEMVLYRFKVTADAAGDVGIGKVTFRVSSTTVATTTVFKLYAYSDSAFSTAAYAQNPPHSREVDIVDETVWNGDATSTSNNTIVFYFNPAGNVSVTNGTARVSESLNVPSGSSRYFELRGTVASATAGDTISVALLGDNAVANNTNLVGRETAFAVDTFAATQADFVWSPNTTSTAATTTNDWLNGYQLPGLPTTEMTQQTFSK